MWDIYRKQDICWWERDDMLCEQEYKSEKNAFMIIKLCGVFKIRIITKFK